MTSPGEAALAVVGMSAVIKQDVPRIGVAKLAEIAGVDADIAKAAKELCAGTLAEPSLPREHNYRTTLDRLSKGMPPGEVQELESKFPAEQHDMAGQFVIVVTQAWQQLKAIFPTADYNTFAGPQQLVPDTEKVWMFFLQLQVLNDPRGVMSLIAAGAILQPQVQVMRQFFPTLSKTIDDAIYDATANAKAAKLSYRLPPRAELGVATWLGRRIVEYDPTPTPAIVPTSKHPPSFKLPTPLESPAQKTDVQADGA